MERILILEDDSKDMQIAWGVANSLGFGWIECHDTFTRANASLTLALRNGQPLPQAIVLDLDLGYESGYELLRIWHAVLVKQGVSMIVWSGLGGNNQEICELFKVNAYIHKSEGAPSLRRAIECLHFN